MKVECLVSCPHCIDQFEPVSRELLSLGVDFKFVVLPFLSTYLDCKNIFLKRVLPFKKTIDSEADIAITTSNQVWLDRYKKLKFKFKYGVNISKTAYNMSKDGASGFDGIIVHGQYEKDLITKQGIISDDRVRLMGYPKYDLFFRENASVDKVKKRLSLSHLGDRKIITYFPTWGEKSSISSFYKSIISVKNRLDSLGKKYFLITKPHHNTFYRFGDYDHEEVWKKLEDISDVLLDVHTSFSDAAIVADIILSDSRSGSLTEAALINPKAKLIGLHVADEFSENYYSKGAFEMCVIVDDPSDLQHAIDSELKNNSRYKKRMGFVKNIFSYIGEDCSRIAAREIIELSRLNKISSTPPKLQPWVIRSIKHIAKVFIKKISFQR